MYNILLPSRSSTRRNCFWSGFDPSNVKNVIYLSAVISFPPYRIYQDIWFLDDIKFLSDYLFFQSKTHTDSISYSLTLFLFFLVILLSIGYPLSFFTVLFATFQKTSFACEDTTSSFICTRRDHQKSSRWCLSGSDNPKYCMYILLVFHFSCSYLLPLTKRKLDHASYYAISSLLFYLQLIKRELKSQKIFKRVSFETRKLLESNMKQSI